MKDGVTGTVAQPDPAALAQAFDELYLDRRRAQRLGQAGFELVESLEITWDNVVRRLTSEI